VCVLWRENSNDRQQGRRFLFDNHSLALDFGRETRKRDLNTIVYIHSIDIWVRAELE
jgi:hypothetical protein